MDVFEKMSWILIEVPKLFLVYYFVMGYRFRENKRVCFFILSALIQPIIVMVAPSYAIYYELLWDLLLILIVFEGKIGKKIVVFLCSWVLITDVDLIIGIIMTLILQLVSIYSELANIAGLVVWIIISYFLKRKGKTYVRVLPLRFLIVITGILFSTGCIASYVYFTLYEQSSDSIKMFSIIQCMLLMVLLLILCIYFVYILLEKKEKDALNFAYQEFVKNQKEYYEKLIEKNEGMKAYRHEVKNHLNTLELLCIENDFEKVKTYIYALNKNFRKNEVIYTGNIVADYFINDMIVELQEKRTNFSYNILGKIPQNINWSDGDLCVLMSNATHNAKEAILKIDEMKDCFFEMKIQNLNDNVIISISNSVLDDESINLSGKTTKEDSENHGYGMNNMRSVIEKNGGDIEWIKEETYITVKIVL